MSDTVKVDASGVGADGTSGANGIGVPAEDAGRAAIDGTAAGGAMV